MSARDARGSTPAPSPVLARPNVVVQLSPARFEQLFMAEAREQLHALAEVTGPTGPAALANALAGAEVLFLSVAGTVDQEALAAAPRLRWIASANAAPHRAPPEAPLSRRGSRHRPGGRPL